MKIKFGKPFTFYKATATGAKPIKGYVVECQWFKDNNMKVVVARNNEWNHWVLYEYHTGQRFATVWEKYHRRPLVVKAINEIKAFMKKNPLGHTYKFNKSKGPEVLNI